MLRNSLLLTKQDFTFHILVGSCEHTDCIIAANRGFFGYQMDFIMNKQGLISWLLH